MAINISVSKITMVIFSIYSNENNYGVGLGMPSFESALIVTPSARFIRQ